MKKANFVDIALLYPTRDDWLTVNVSIPQAVSN